MRASWPVWVGLRRTRLLLVLGALPFCAVAGAQAPTGAEALPLRYSYIQHEATYRGPSKGELRAGQPVRKRVLRDGAAYRIDQYVPADSPVASQIIFNNGDGQDYQFLYFPERRRAWIDLPSVHYKFARKYPERWKLQNLGPAKKPAAPPLRTYQGRAESERERQLNPSGRLAVARKTENVDGKKCTVYTITFEELKDPQTRRTDRNSRHTQKLWVWEKYGLVLQSDHLAEYLGTTPPRPTASRRVTRISDLRLNPQIDRAQFELPAGTTCEVYSDYPMRLPKGVTPHVIAGSGLNLLN
jgi:hypothetical protein